MSARDEQAASESRPTGIGPGDRLQAARIQQGLSLEDVANRMHLSPNILEAIEENNFDEITAPIFVKGYLRAYARIVRLDEDEMIQQYMDYYSEEDPPITSTSNVAPELSVTDARIKWTTYLVVLVVAALLGAWWWNKEKSEETTISLDSQSSGVTQQAQDEQPVVTSEIEAVSESVAALTAEETPDETPAPMPETAMSDAAAGDDSAVVETMSAEETVPPPADEAEPEAAAQAESDALELATAESVTEPDAEPVVEPAAEPGPPALSNEPTLIAPSGTDKLLIIVNADTWADIKDGTDYQMVYDLLRADQTVELTGSAPFSVFLGNGHGVEIRFNGEDFDISNRIRNDNTARIRIGGQ